MAYGMKRRGIEFIEHAAIERNFMIREHFQPIFGSGVGQINVPNKTSLVMLITILTPAKYTSLYASWTSSLLFDGECPSHQQAPCTKYNGRSTGAEAPILISVMYF